MEVGKEGDSLAKDLAEQKRIILRALHINPICFEAAIYVIKWQEEQADRIRKFVAQHARF